MIRRTGGTIWQKSPPRPFAEFASHEAYRFLGKYAFPKILMPVRNLHKCIIITIIVPSEHDAVIVGKTLRPHCSKIYAPS
jgi:hypothetical protein